MSEFLKPQKPWIFMGVGNVLFNEDPAYSQIYLMIYRTIQKRDESITFERLLNERDELIKDGHILPIKVLIEQALPENEKINLKRELKAVLEDNWLKYNPLNDDTIDFLKELEKHFYLGIIANGPSFLRAIMQDVGIKKYFKVIVISEEIGIPKPNNGIFQEAINLAKEYCESKNEKFDKSNVVMVGDSLELDILPAKKNGMTGIQIIWDLDKKYKKSELLNDEIFVKYLNHLKQHSSRRREPANEEEKPAFIVSSTAELKNLLLSDEFSKAISQVKLV
ncbi:MAG: HAD family hydrolase [Spirochaetia bacterium]|nr:HAD family hydrolase [Spirochaetia bacterium]